MNKQEEKEEWKIISETNYEISNLGRVRNKNEYIMKNQITKTEYEYITLYIQLKRKKYFIHRLVTIAFISNSQNFPFVNHKDRNKRNNRVTNLEWVNNSMNAKHCVETGRDQYKRAVRQYDLQHNFIKEFSSIREAAKAVGLKPNNIHMCCTNPKRKTAGGFIWKYAEKIKKKPIKDVNWKKINNYPGYKLYENGQIYSEKRKRYLTLGIINGYYRVKLSHDGVRKNYMVHILVAQHFCDNSDNKPLVNHKDGNRLNNHYTNLEWVTHSENTRHAHDLGLKKKLKRIHKYTEDGVLITTFDTVREAAESVRSETKALIASIIKRITETCKGKRESIYGYKWKYGESLYEYLQKAK
uniref:HNH endonuclease n=1 Tax=Iridovirus LCIVAC01 TaxID=2506607 RepID=A0A481YQ58_9VIRU|nr:MAG: HNH endonuclease [Iridovirus LCIVAC01]